MSEHEKGDLASAEEHYRKVIQLDPQNTQAFFNLGVLLDKKGKVDEAMEAMRKVMKLDPQNAEAYNYVGYSYADRNIRLDEAKELVEKAVQIEPQNAYYLDSLGWVYYRRADLVGAKAQLEKAEGYIKDGQKDNAVVYDHLGEVFLKMGDKESAVLQWQKAAELDPDNKDYPSKISKAKTTRDERETAPADPCQDQPGSGSASTKGGWFPRTIPGIPGRDPLRRTDS